MEESKQSALIIAVEKSSQLTADQVRDYLNSPTAKVESHSSPKGWRVCLDSEQVNILLEKGEDTLNGEKLNFAEIDAYCTIFIKGITEKISEADLTAALSDVGRICMTSIPKDTNYRSKGMAYVRFNRKDDALKATELHSTLVINSVPLEVQKYNPKDTNTVNESATFRNFPDDYSEEDMANLLQEYGTISNLIMNKEKCTGSVYYSTPGSVQKASQALNGKSLVEGRVFMIAPSETERKRASNYNNLYIGGVPPSISEAEVRQFFEKYGEIESLLCPTRKGKDGSDIRKPFVYLSFKDSKIASDVIKELDSKTYWGSTLNIDYYDPDRKKNNKEKYNPSTTTTQTNMMQEFAAAMANMLAQFSNMNTRGGSNRGSTRGYHSRGAPRGAPRGAMRGMPRGSTRGAPRGVPGAGYYNVRSQYDHFPTKPMMPNPMSMPPLGGMPPLGSASATPGAGYGHHPMHTAPPPMPTMTAAPVIMTAPIASEEHADDDEVNVLSLSTENYANHENEIGTFLYNKVELSHGSELAGRITGMFLDLPPEEIYQILHDDTTYQKYISDAEQLIKNEGEGGEDME